VLVGHCVGRSEYRSCQHRLLLAHSITVIASGERWPDGSLRPSLEDLLGAGAILAGMTGKPSPEARAAIAAFRDAARDLSEVLSQCASGRELIQRGGQADVGYAAQLNASTTVPVLRCSQMERFVRCPRYWLIMTREPSGMPDSMRNASVGTRTHPLLTAWPNTDVSGQPCRPTVPGPPPNVESTLEWKPNGRISGL